MSREATTFMAIYLYISSIIFGMKRVKHYPEQRQMRHPNGAAAMLVNSVQLFQQPLGAERINVVWLSLLMSTATLMQHQSWSASASI